MLNFKIRLILYKKISLCLRSLSTGYSASCCMGAAYSGNNT